MSLGVYVHVPFCLQKCRYCAFYSVPLSAMQATERTDQIALYLHGIKLELARGLTDKDAPEGVSSLFIGGGTPTALREGKLEDLLGALHESMVFLPEAEKTVECNPGTLNPVKLKLLRRYGLNRISLGVQSFNDILLRKIGRVHTAEQAKTAVRMIRTERFDNLNLDLMFGLPGQTMADWQQSIEEALVLVPEHFSLYGLTLEEGTPLGEEYLPDSGRLPLLPEDDLQAEMYAWAVQRLKAAGYRRYETSNFSLPGRECRHNLGYWRGKDYLGLGPGAVSCRNGKRWKNTEDLNIYNGRLLASISPEDPEETEELSLEQRLAERMILGLRLTEGVEITAVEKEFGIHLRNKFAPVLERYEKQGILRVEAGYLKLHPEYAFVANAILQDFV